MDGNNIVIYSLNVTIITFYKLNASGQDTISMSYDHSFSTDSLLSIVKILSSASEKGENFQAIPE